MDNIYINYIYIWLKNAEKKIDEISESSFCCHLSQVDMDVPTPRSTCSAHAVNGRFGGLGSSEAEKPMGGRKNGGLLMGYYPLVN